jgi:HAD superfamily hydrolase (TIGR01509 family)
VTDLAGAEAVGSRCRVFIVRAQAIVFDLFETLITESATPPPGVSSLAPALGCAHQPEAFRARWKALRLGVITGRIRFRDALQRIAESLGAQPDDDVLTRVCDERIRARAAAFEQIEPAVVAMLDSIRSRGLRAAVISNCCAEDVTAWSASALASRVDGVVFSFELGAAKPDPAIYLEATRRLGVDPSASDTVFVGDGQDDELTGAARAGLHPVRATWFLSRWPHFRDEPCAFRSLAQIDRLADLF